MSSVLLDQLLDIQAGSDVSLQLQIRMKIAEAILRGNFALDVPLPSSRLVSKQLHIARNTVVLAYQRLEDDGYLVAKPRRGYFVNPEVLKGRATSNQKTGIVNEDGVGETTGPDWSSLIKSTQREQSNIRKPVDWQDYKYPFVYGQFDSNLFPTQNWRECCRDSVSMGDISDWAADHFVNDDPSLLDEIRTRILPRRGIWVEEGQIMITVGTQQGIYILSKMLLDSDSVMGVENPGYTDMRNIVKLNQAKLKPLPIDENGLIIGDHLKECNCIFVTPSHQSPTTVTMPLYRREELLDMASKEDMLIIEDDYECETNFSAKHTPALKSLDKEGRVIYAGSFSKILAPGLRLGYIVGPKEIIAEAIALRRLMVRHPPANNQRSVALFIKRGYYDALAAKLLKEYERRWHVMKAALNTHLPESYSTPTFGGSSYWVRGPEYLNARQLQSVAQKQSLIIEPGDIHFYQDNPPLNYFRLGYSSIKTENIDPGIALLAKLISQFNPKQEGFHS